METTGERESVKSVAARLQKDFSVYFFNDTATTEIYTLSLHDALPIFRLRAPASSSPSPSSSTTPLPSATGRFGIAFRRSEEHTSELRHANISYGVVCFNKTNQHTLAAMVRASRRNSQCILIGASGMAT